MKLKKAALIFIVYCFLKIASRIDFHNDTLNYVFKSVYLKYILFCYVFYKILHLFFNIRKTYTQQNKEDPFLDRALFSIKNGLSNYDHRIQSSICQEFSMFYYAFFSGKVKKQNYQYEFTYHKDNTAVSLYWAFIILTLVETGIIHYLLFIYNFHWINGILLLVNLYTLVFFLGHIRAMKAKPIVLDNHSITLNNGLFISEKILIHEIEKIYAYSENIKIQDALKIGLIGKLEPMNVVIEFKIEKSITLIYGIKRTAKNITFHVDDYLRFLEIVNSEMIAE